MFFVSVLGLLFYVEIQIIISLQVFLQVMLTPPPDFVVSQLQCQDTYSTGDTMAISYTVTNLGNGSPFERFWQDALVSKHVYLYYILVSCFVSIRL